VTAALDLTRHQPGPGIRVERLNQSEPIIEPTQNWWETGVTFNAACAYLPRSLANDSVIRAVLARDDLSGAELREGVVAILYRARPEEDEYQLTRSYMGLAVFTPGLELLRRPEKPILYPGENPGDVDYYGIEDPRVTWIEDWFYAAYCGPRNLPAGGLKPDVCLARSRDLVNWEKLGLAFPASRANEESNKDAVLFPGRINGQHFMLHRPVLMREDGACTKDMHLAVAAAPRGPWKDCGMVMRALPNPAVASSHMGAGSVPIPLGRERYLIIYHVGEMLRPGGKYEKEYTLGAAILDFSRFDPECPEKVVTRRLERMMVPETPSELIGPSQETVANVVFTCGTYEYRGFIYLVYGGADTYTLAARVNAAELVEALEQCR
jgi:beta-1,2-mannobiose phosphorylase / 1,2-beta-oligomannan phosphorylase